MCCGGGGGYGASVQAHDGQNPVQTIISKNTDRQTSLHFCIVVIKKIPYCIEIGNKLSWSFKGYGCYIAKWLD